MYIGGSCFQENITKGIGTPSPPPPLLLETFGTFSVILIKRFQLATSSEQKESPILIAQLCAAPVDVDGPCSSNKVSCLMFFIASSAIDQTCSVIEVFPLVDAMFSKPAREARAWLNTAKGCGSKIILIKLIRQTHKINSTIIQN